ncbi:MAG: uracil phosphoribosyltransferase [Fuerstiella sp.]
MSVVTSLDHPLATHHLGHLRSVDSDSAEFRRRIQVLTGMLLVEATRKLPVQAVDVVTPLETIATTQLQPSIAIAPILRAGLGMVDPVLQMIPSAVVWHLGMFRDEQTALPVRYYDKVPRDQSASLALVLDPMLATGGSAIMAIDILKECDVDEIRMLSVIAAPEGIQAVQEKHSDVDLFTCVIDQQLNSQNYIVPGLGDAGDRIFNTRG